MLALPDPPPQLGRIAHKAISLAGDDYHDRTTLVHDAIFGHTKLNVEEALSIEPASVNVLDIAGLAPLHWAVLHNRIEDVTLLLSWRACVDLVTSGEKRTALHLAARAGSLGCVRTLLDAGANVNYRDVYERTALCLAVLTGAMDVVTLLLDRGADVHAQERDGITILHRAIEPDNDLKDDRALCSIIVKLIKFGINLDHADKSGETAFMTTIRHNYPTSFQTLVAHGACLDKKNNDGWTIFHYAASYGSSELMQYLAETDLSNVNPDLLDDTGQTAMALLRRRLAEKDVQLAKLPFCDMDGFQNVITRARKGYLILH